MSDIFGCLIKNGGDKMNMKYLIGVICAVTIVIGALAGTYASATEDAEIQELTMTASIDDVMEHMEAKGFEITADGDTLTAYRESTGRTMTITMDCPDGECPLPGPGEGAGIGPMGKNFRFRMGPGGGPMHHGQMGAQVNPEEFQEQMQQKLAEMGLDEDEIENVIEHFGRFGPGKCPFSGESEAE